MHFFLSCLPLISGVMIGGGILYGFKQLSLRNKIKELEEISDSPFKFYVDSDGRLIFELCDDATLWCEYGFGIRSDGIYGIDGIDMLGINGAFGHIDDLKIGQSVFPIIKAMEEFITWIDKKPFETKFKNDFEREWQEMKKNLDNLRYLESEVKKKEKKSK